MIIITLGVIPTKHAAVSIGGCGTDDGFIGYMDDVNIITAASNTIYLYLVEILLLKCYWESHSYVTILLKIRVT